MGTSNMNPESAAASPAGEPSKIEPSKIEFAASASPKIEASAHSSFTSSLPQVEAPTLDKSTPGESAPSSAAAAEVSAPKSSGRSRFTLLAASIAAAAAVGSFAGALAAIGVLHWAPASSAATAADSRGAQQLSARLAAEYSTLKANVDGLSRTTSAQFAKLGERLDRSERAQAEPAAKLARIAEALDRLEKRAAASAETTGSIAAPAALQTADAKAGEKLDGWVLHEVRRGHAILESRNGGLFEVSQGGFLPGVGRVQEIKRQDGRWVVVTSRGQISSYYQ